MSASATERQQVVRQAKEHLRELLGERCAQCGEDCQLEVNHIYGRQWTPRKVASHTRWRRYAREAREGLINWLCRACNNKYQAVRLPEELREAATRAARGKPGRPKTAKEEPF